MLWQQVELLPQQFLPSLELQAIASLPQQDFSPLPQQPLPFFAAHCLASFPEQQFMADLLSFWLLQQVMSLP